MWCRWRSASPPDPQSVPAISRQACGIWIGMSSLSPPSVLPTSAARRRPSCSSRCALRCVASVARRRPSCSSRCRVATARRPEGDMGGDQAVRQASGGGPGRSGTIDVKGHQWQKRISGRHHLRAPSMIFPVAAALTNEDAIPMPIIFIFVAIPAFCPTTQEVCPSRLVGVGCSVGMWHEGDGKGSCYLCLHKTVKSCKVWTG